MFEIAEGLNAPAILLLYTHDAVIFSFICRYRVADKIYIAKIFFYKSRLETSLAMMLITDF